MMPMEKTYTNNALIQFLYHEMSAVETVEMAQAIEEDRLLYAEFNEFLIARAQLPKALFQPNRNSVSHILQYSAKTALEAHC